MFSHLGTKRYNFKNETQLFKVIPHTSKFQKNRPASPERNTFEGSWNTILTAFFRFVASLHALTLCVYATSLIDLNALTLCAQTI